MLPVVVVGQSTHGVDMRKPCKQRLPGLSLFHIPDVVRSFMCKMFEEMMNVWSVQYYAFLCSLEKYRQAGIKKLYQYLWWLGSKCYISCTLRSGIHESPTMIRIFSFGLENNHASKWISDHFPEMLKYVLFLENCPKSIWMHGCS